MGAGAAGTSFPLYEALITGSYLNVFHTFPSDLDVLIFALVKADGADPISLFHDLVRLIHEFSQRNVETQDYSLETKQGVSGDGDIYRQIQWTFQGCRVDLNFSTMTAEENLLMKQNALARKMLVDENAFYNLRTHQLYRLGKGDCFHIRCDLFKSNLSKNLSKDVAGDLEAIKKETIHFIAMAYILKKMALNYAKPFSMRSLAFLDAFNTLAIKARSPGHESAWNLLSKAISYIFEKYWPYQSPQNQLRICEFLTRMVDWNQAAGVPLTPSLMDRFFIAPEKRFSGYALVMGGSSGTPPGSPLAVSAPSPSSP
jgi:hypothetical protein